MTDMQFVIILMLLLAFCSLICIGIFMENPYHRKPTETQRRYPTVQEIREMNKQYAAKKAAKEIKVERGKVLAFSRKPWYKSTKRGVNDGNY